MYSTLGRATPSQPSQQRDQNPPDDDDDVTHVQYPSPRDVENLAELYNTLSRGGADAESGVHKEFSEFLEKEKERGKDSAGLPQRRLAVSFKDITTWGLGDESTTAKTFVDAVVRTLILRDIYEWTIKPWLRKPSQDECRPLIRNISGAVRDGEIMLYVKPISKSRL